MKSISFSKWLMAIKVVLWVSLIGFGLTLFNTAGLVFNSDQVFTNVKLKNQEKISVPNGELTANSGVFSFKTGNLLDKLIFKHVSGYHDFIQSLFTFVICCILLITIREINANSPFTLKVATRIRLIGLLYIVYGLISIGAGYYIYLRINTDQISGDYSGFRDDLSDIKVGVFILILAFIYRIGASFQEENQLTV